MNLCAVFVQSGLSSTSSYFVCLKYIHCSWNGGKNPLELQTHHNKTDKIWNHCVLNWLGISNYFNSHALELWLLVSLCGSNAWMNADHLYNNVASLPSYKCFPLLSTHSILSTCSVRIFKLHHDYAWWILYWNSQNDIFLRSKSIFNGRYYSI
jgi:hypothetical protein